MLRVNMIPNNCASELHNVADHEQNSIALMISMTISHLNSCFWAAFL